MNIYVGNLSYDVKEDDLRELFSPFGQVESISIITDRATGKPRGFGFVTMPDNAEAEKAIEDLNGKEVSGRALKVNQAKERAAGSGGRGRRGGGGGPRRSW